MFDILDAVVLDTDKVRKYKNRDCAGYGGVDAGRGGIETGDQSH
jgi:hypothetical protein